MKRTRFQRKLSHKGLRPSGKRLGKGKRTKEWDSTRAKDLKPAFKRAGIETCEGRRENCMIDNGLGFAHRLKRRNITTKAELRRVVLLCNNCHDFYELQGEAKMTVALDEIIAGREVQPWT